MRTLVAASVAALALACAGSPAAPSSEAGAAGDRLYRSKCAACHRAYPPSSRDRATWAQVLSRMAPKAKLSEAEREQILGFLQSSAKDAPAPGARP